jgi:hypothetical protein
MPVSDKNSYQAGELTKASFVYFFFCVNRSIVFGLFKNATYYTCHFSATRILAPKILTAVWNKKIYVC